MSHAISQHNQAVATGVAAEVLALTLWAEAGTQPVRALEALAALVVNRARAAEEDAAARLRFAPGAEPQPWPLLVARVCRAPFQFGCWNPRNPRHAQLRNLPLVDPSLAMCRRIAARAVAGSLPDATGGATHWHAAEELPAWAIGQAAVAEIGGLVFYKPEG